MTHSVGPASAHCLALLARASCQGGPAGLANTARCAHTSDAVTMPAADEVARRPVVARWPRCLQVAGASSMGSRGRRRSLPERRLDVGMEGERHHRVLH
jgi:hypothetical protein